jgi:hypothetical protein
VTSDFWGWFFGIDAVAVFVWAFFRGRGEGLEGEKLRIKTVGFALFLALCSTASYLLAHARMEWQP